MSRSKMNPAPIETAEMDRMLAGEEELVPSSGFLAAVMERVREEAAAPAPIPFPWARAVPGIVLAASVFGWGAFELGRCAWAAMSTISFNPSLLPAAVDRPLQEAGWVMMALAASLLSWLLSRRLAGRAGTL